MQKNEPAEIVDSPASRSLRKQAAEAFDSGDLTTASILTERALRLAPRDAENYLLLANIRLQQLRPAEALQITEKGLSLNATDTTTQKLTASQLKAKNLLD